MTALSEPPVTAETSEVALAERARAGDSDAFGEIYSRYFTPIHDFVYRMVRDPSEAADVTQEAFIRALRSIGSLDQPEALRGWLYTIARNTALNHLRVPVLETKERVPMGEDGDAAFDVVDPDAFADPAQAAEARAMSRLVWEAAAGLSAAEYTLLDLHVRHELGGAEIAKVLGTSPNSIYVRLNRVRKTFERSVKALVLMRSGKESCDRLALLLEERQLDRMSPEALRVIEDHAHDCDECDRRRGALLAPLTVFGAFTPVAADPSLYAGIFTAVSAASAAGAAAGGAAAGGAAGGAAGAGGVGTAGAAGAGAAGGIAGTIGATGLAIVAAIGVVAVVAAALVLPISPFAVVGGGDGTTQAGIVAEPTQVPTTDPTQSAPAVVPPTETPTVATPVPTEAPAAAEETPLAAAPPASVDPEPPLAPAPSEPTGVSTDPVEVTDPPGPADPLAPPVDTPEPAATPSPEPPVATEEPVASTPEPVVPESPPTMEPTQEPTTEPTVEPTSEPTALPTAQPTEEPTEEPSATPEPSPTATPAPNVLFSVVIEGGLPLLNVPFQVVLSVENEGPGPAEDVEIDLPLPTGLSFVEASSALAGVTCSADDVLLTCTIDLLEEGETATIEVVLLMTGMGGDVTLEFMMLAGNGSPEPVLAPLPFVVLQPGLTIQPRFVDALGDPAPTVHYTLVNTGDIPLASLAVIDDACPVVLPLDAAGELEPLLPGETREFACSTAPAEEYAGSASAIATSAAGETQSAIADYVVDLLPRVAVARNVSPAELPAPGGEIAVHFVIANNGTEELVMLAAEDSELGSVMELCGFDSTLPAGTEVECKIASKAGGEAGDVLEATFRVLVADDEGNEVTESAISRVAIIAPARPLIFEFVAASPYFEAQVAFPEFKVRLVNNGPGAVTIVDGEILGAGVSLESADCSGGMVLALGESIDCLLTLRIVGAVGLVREPGVRITVQRDGELPEVLTRTVTVTGCAGPGSNGEPVCPWNASGGAGGALYIASSWPLDRAPQPTRGYFALLALGVALLGGVSAFAVRRVDR